MNADDPRLGRIRPPHGLPDRSRRRLAAARPGDVIARRQHGRTRGTPPATPSIRGLVLFASRYLDQKVTVTGQFGGRNLLGDLPDAPAQEPVRFRAAVGGRGHLGDAISVRAGRDFELALDARIDTGRWLRGQRRRAAGPRPAVAGRHRAAIKLTPSRRPRRPTDGADPRAGRPAAGGGLQRADADETDVAVSTNVRIQFSRDHQSGDVQGTRVARPLCGNARRDGPARQPTSRRSTCRATACWRSVSRNPWSASRTVTIELHDGILGTDQQPLKPWTLTFETGS